MSEEKENELQHRIAGVVAGAFFGYMLKEIGLVSFYLSIALGGLEYHNAAEGIILGAGIVFGYVFYNFVIFLFILLVLYAVLN